MKYFKSLIAAALVAIVFVAAKPAGYGVGDTVADFKLKNVDGKMVSLADFKNAKGVIVIFDCKNTTTGLLLLPRNTQVLFLL
jgi:AhpC/TSA family